MTITLHDLVQRVAYAKRKYHAKVLSTSSLLITLERSFSVEDIFAIYVWILSDLISNLAVFLSLLLDIDPVEFEQLWLKFKIELPSTDELLRGIWIKFEKIKVEGLGSIDDFIDLNIAEEFKDYFKQTRIQKAIYGKTPYNYSYYDPPDIRKFIANTLERLFMQYPEHQRFKSIIDGFTEVFNVNPTLSQYIFNRFQIIKEVQRQCFILGFGVLGYSQLTPKENGMAKVEVVDYNSRYLVIRFTHLDHIHDAFILDITPLNMGYLAPSGSIYVVPSPQFTKWVAELSFDAIHRLPLSPYGIANYQRIEEMKDFRKSERADQYMALQLMRGTIEQSIDALLDSFGLTVTQKRQYKNAINHLIGILAKRHKWGYSPFKTMTMEEIVAWWLDYWERQGLNKSLLEKIYDRLKRWIPEWAKQKEYLGKLVSLRRKYQALWK